MGIRSGRRVVRRCCAERWLRGVSLWMNECSCAFEAFLAVQHISAGKSMGQHYWLRASLVTVSRGIHI